jgi:hypothetical protein
MIKNLMLHFKEAMTTTYHPNDSTFDWFQTELGQTFGIQKTSLADKERELLSALFQPVETLNQDSLTLIQRKWIDYLYSENNDGQSPLPAEHSTVRFYYFYLKQTMDDKQSFEEAIRGIIHSDLIIWLDFSHGIIIEDKPTTTSEVESFKDLSASLTTDFYIESTFYIGQIQKNDADLNRKFALEHSCFQAMDRSANQEKALTFYEALPLLIIKAPSSLKKDILSNHLVETLEERETLHTIATFLQSNLNASSTAKRLFIHRNSLHYRLERLLEKTGVDIRTFSNATFMFLAIMLVRHEN